MFFFVLCAVRRNLTKSILPYDQYRVAAPKRKGIAHHISQTQPSFALCNVIQVTGWVRDFVINSWRHDLILQREDTADQLQRSAAPDGMSQRRFIPHHGDFIGTLSKHFLDCPGLVPVVWFRSRCMCVDIVNVLYAQASICQGAAY